MVVEIATRADIACEAMQFEGTQKNVDHIQEWIAQYDGRVVVMWNGNDAVFRGDVKIKAEPGLLELYHTDPHRAPMEATPGDWIIKSRRDTFYTVKKEDFNEIFMVVRHVA